MFDDVERLREDPRLVELLAHYADLGKDSREAWHDRVMQMDGIDARELSKLHGELIAFDWIEQNIGQASTLKDGVVPACYRITSNGVRDICQIRGVAYETTSVENQDRKTLRFSRKKKQKRDTLSV
jgi:hypothetical protein